jgi:uncharacterized membrane protein
MDAMHPAALMRDENPCLSWFPAATGLEQMSASDPTANAASSANTTSQHWVANQPYLLLCITALTWAGNAIVGRLAVGHIPPVTLSFLRWSLAFFIILPFAWKHLRQDWGAIRNQLGMMIFLSVTGIGIFNTLQYWALEYTQALNTLLLQSALPLFVALWSLILLGIRLTLTQAFWRFCCTATSRCSPVSPSTRAISFSSSEW